MKGKVTILCENCVFRNIGAIAEHGWAVFIETDQGNFLFDTGQGKSIVNNASRVFRQVKKNTNINGSNKNNPIFCLLRIANAKLPPAIIRRDRLSITRFVIEDSRIPHTEPSPKRNAVCSI